MAAFSESEQVVVRVYSMLLIAVDIETVCESDPIADVKEQVIEHEELGQVPQRGLLEFVNIELPLAKVVDSEVIFVTHQPVKS